MTFRIVAICSALLLLNVSAAAQQPPPIRDFSANGMLPKCRATYTASKVDRLDQGFCLGIVQGVSGMLEGLKALCLPRNVTLDQSVRVVVAYIEARPAKMHVNFVALAAEALATTWPCPKP